MQQEPLPPPVQDPYRVGYRDGFRDGFTARPLDAAGSQDKKRGDAQDKQQDSGKPAGDAASDTQDKQGGDKGQDKDSPADKNATPLYQRPLLVGGVLLVLLLAIIAAILFWRHSRRHEKTDDAFIDGRASAVAAQVAGRVTRLLIADNQVVHGGDLLLEIDSRDAQARAAQAGAQLADAQSQLAQARAEVLTRRAAVQQAGAQTRQAQAELDKAERDAARYRAVDPDAVPRQQADAAATAARSARAQFDAARGNAQSAATQVAAAQAQVRAAEAGIQAAQAALDAANLQVTYGRVVAPVDGRVTRRAVELGNVISAGQPLMSIVGDGLWVTANFKETQLTQMRPGQAVDITVDAFPDVHFRGHVDSIQRGTGSYFSMLPAENATGNYVKVVQRVPVKIVFDDATQLSRYAIGPGMSVTPDVQLP